MTSTFGKWLLTFLIILAWTESIHAETIHLRCAGTPVSFHFEQGQQLKCLCSTVSNAVSFLKELGLEADDTISIRMVSELTGTHESSLFGISHPATHEIEILTYEIAAKLPVDEKDSFGLELNEEIWCSFVAHELAHVVIDRYIDPRIEAHTTAEYIAFVTQLSILSDGTRAALLNKQSGIEAYRTTAEMSELYYLLAPNRFAVKCYLHFQAQTDPKETIQHLLQQGNGF